MRKLSVIFLSVFMIYAGAMWAFAACLRDDVHSAISVLDNHSDFQASVGHDHPQDPSPSVIHCTPVTHQVGPAARMAAAEILRSDKGVALDMVSFPYAAVSATLRNDLWLKVVFKRIVTFSSPIDLARHLFFSILQI